MRNGNNVKYNFQKNFLPKRWYNFQNKSLPK